MMREILYKLRGIAPPPRSDCDIHTYIINVIVYLSIYLALGMGYKMRYMGRVQNLCERFFGMAYGFEI